MRKGEPGQGLARRGVGDPAVARLARDRRAARERGVRRSHRQLILAVRQCACASLRADDAELCDQAPVAAELPRADERLDARDRLGCTDCSVAGANIADQLESAGRSWGAYLEDLPSSSSKPSPCFEGGQSGGYAKKHNPFAYYTDISRSPARCRHVQGFAQLAGELRAGRLPEYVWISPNLCDDGHDCGEHSADQFLARSVPALLRALGPRGFLVLQWDEGTSDRGCCGVAAGGHIATIVAGPRVRHSARSAAAIDQYGVLGSIEEAFGLAPLGGAADPRSGRLTALFQSPPRLR